MGGGWARRSKARFTATGDFLEATEAARVYRYRYCSREVRAAQTTSCPKTPRPLWLCSRWPVPYGSLCRILPCPLIGPRLSLSKHRKLLQHRHLPTSIAAVATFLPLPLPITMRPTGFLALALCAFATAAAAWSKEGMYSLNCTQLPVSGISSCSRAASASPHPTPTFAAAVTVAAARDRADM
jgi:hypothetical protein